MGVRGEYRQSGQGGEAGVADRGSRGCGGWRWGERGV